MSHREGTRVPSALIAPILKEYLDAQEPAAFQYKGLGDGGGWEVEEQTVSAAIMLAEEVGVTPDWLYRILRVSDNAKTISFDLADALLCAIDGPHLWREEPLVDLYMSIDLTYLDERDAARAAA